MQAVRLGSNGFWSDLSGTSTGANGWAKAMNNAGVVVGIAGGFSVLGFVTISGKSDSLKDLIVNRPSNVTYVHVDDINDAGVICGSVTIQAADGTSSEISVLLFPSATPAP